VTIDVESRTIEVALSDEEITARVDAYESPEPAYASGVMAKYAATVSSASAGAITG
jgi:dihydroxy-acid dehydratase